jgi:sporulation related protein
MALVVGFAVTPPTGAFGARVSADSIKPAPFAASGGTGGGWTIEAADAATLAVADSIQGWLWARGYGARVIGTRAPFRVRIGHFPSMREALVVARRLLRTGLTPFVTQGRQ